MGWQGEDSYETETPFIDIIFPNARQLARLAFKLADYHERYGRELTIPDIPASDFLAFGHDNLRGLFRFHVLRTVIELGKLPGRDTLLEPITIREVANRFRATTGVNVLGAIAGERAIRYWYDAEINWHMPIFGREDDHSGLYPKETDSFGTLFVGAYCVVRAYAWNRRDLVPADRWLVDVSYLADLPVQTEGD